MPAGEVIAKAVVEYEGRFDPASKKQMENELRTTAGELTKLFAGVFASAKFIQGMSGAIQAASNLNEEVNKTKVVFGDSGDEVIKFSTKAATAKSAGCSPASVIKFRSSSVWPWGQCDWVNCRLAPCDRS